ncbi:biotin-dependent carboxyltransferase family protein [Pseudaquabacterium rugosum]|uniref:Biotin-dependent carboxyltransferase family protein n=1 Tax=Pseudaquabacterium rugosum TaxID=2984194 RepID=A0ABU9BEA1_9BURK
MIEILTAGAMTTVQDTGRQGALRWGVGTAGAMDPLALEVGNRLLGNAPDAAAVEVQVFPFKARFNRDGVFALTGADTGARLDGEPLLPWARHRVRAGQVLTLDLPRPGPHRQARACLCLPGGIDVAPVLGSRSTQLRGAFGGWQGRPLRAGDVLPAAATDAALAEALDRWSPLAVVPPVIALPQSCDGHAAIRVLPAAEHEAYDDDSRAAFWQQTWKITPQSDRYGYRLAGEQALRLSRPLEMRSHGIVPGVIQVPPDGQPIVQMRDAQPSGGYPKIGAVIEPDLWRLGQAPIGSRVRFVQVDWDEAVAAERALRAWLDGVADRVALYATLKGAA